MDRDKKLNIVKITIKFQDYFSPIGVLTGFTKDYIFFDNLKIYV